MLDRKFHYAQACARKIEEDLYFMTHSQLEYYHVLAVIIYKIKKEQPLPEQQPSTKEYLNVQQLINAMRCPNSTQKHPQKHMSIFNLKIPKIKWKDYPKIIYTGIKLNLAF